MWTAGMPRQLEEEMESVAIWDHVLSPGLALGLALLKTRTAKPVPKLQAMFQALLTSQDCPYPATKSYPLKAPSIQSSMRCGKELLG